jgi:hypothetical protein
MHENQDCPDHRVRAPNAGPDAPTFEVLATPNARQQRALNLIQQVRLQAEA